jgi:hypothetical protein
MAADSMAVDSTATSRVEDTAAAIGTAVMDGEAAGGAAAITATGSAHTGIITTMATATIIIAVVGDIATDTDTSTAGPSRGRFFVRKRMKLSDRSIELWCPADTCHGPLNANSKWIGVAAITIGILKISATRIPQASTG